MESFVVDSNIAHVIIVRILMSFFLGLIIGLERGIAHKAVGFRTLALVCVGSTGFTLVSMYGFEQVDTSRVAAQIVTGIGFLGAGAILHRGHVTKGLTTAATLWVVAAIGMACGSGMLVLACVITLMALILLWVLKPVKRKLDNFAEKGAVSKKKN
jgi:putative Mg2+ transporter-C (MgtC) family protein